MLAAFERGDLRLVMHFNIGVLFDSLDQVARHGVRQPVRTHQHFYLVPGLRKIHGGLTGGISPAHHGHVIGAAKLCLHVGRAVIDALALELFEIRDARLVVLRARGDHHGAGGKFVAVIQHHLEGTFCAVELLDAVRHHHPRAELLRLHGGACRKLLA